MSPLDTWLGLGVFLCSAAAAAAAAVAATLNKRLRTIKSDFLGSLSPINRFLLWKLNNPTAIVHSSRLQPIEFNRFDSRPISRYKTRNQKQKTQTKKTKQKTIRFRNASKPAARETCPAHFVALKFISNGVQGSETRVEFRPRWRWQYAVGDCPASRRWRGQNTTPRPSSRSF